VRLAKSTIKHQTAIAVHCGVQLPTPCWVLSDAHLGVAAEPLERALLALLAAAPQRVRSVIINGDLFEFWFGWRHVMPRDGYRAVAALAAARDAGLPILFIGGNHDCWSGDALARDTGVTYHLGAWEGSIGPWRTRIDHGDGLRDAEDRRYRALRSVLRNKLAERAYRWIHPDVGVWLAKRSSHTSRNTRPKDGGRGLRDVAHATLSARHELDLVIYGHSHVTALERAASGGVYANPGAWLDAPTFLSIDDRSIVLRQWDGSAEGHRLDALDRRAEKSLSKA
jgi:UDP-2,3-diacylglucosamine hydrolase